MGVYQKVNISDSPYLHTSIQGGGGDVKVIKILGAFSNLVILSSTVRVPENLYQALQEIRASLEAEHYSAAPSLQDMVSVALQRLIDDWHDANIQPELLEALLEHRKEARSRMGNRTSHNS